MNTIIRELRRNLWSYRWILLGILIYYGYFALFHTHEPNCIIKHTIGLPCPGCGMSRAAWYLMTFRLSEAFMYHPLIFLMPFIIGILLLRGMSFIQPLYQSKWVWTVVVILFIGVYIARMSLYFPGIEPMTYYPDSWLQNLLLN